MKVFHKRGKGSIVMMVVLAMLLQIVGPVAQNVYAAIDDNAFRVVDERLEEGTAYIDWEFTLDLDNKVDGFTYTGNFNLEDEVEEGLIEDDEDGTVIGTYSISTEGKVTVAIYPELYEDEEETPADPEDEEEPSQDETPTEEQETMDVEKPNFIGKTLTTLASLTEDMGGLLEGNGEVKEVKSFSGTMEGPGATPKESEPTIELGVNALSKTGSDLSNKNTNFIYDLFFYTEDGIDENGGLKLKKIEETEINIEGFETIFFGMETSFISDSFEFQDGDFLDIDITPLLDLAGFSGDDLNGEMDIYADEDTVVGKYWVETIGNNYYLKISFDQGSKFNSKDGVKFTDRFVQANIGFDISKAGHSGSVIEKIEFEGDVKKTFTIIRKTSTFDTPISKTGAYDPNTDTIAWTIDVNKSLSDLEGVKLEDEIHEGLEVIEVKEYDLKIVLENKEVKEEQGTNAIQHAITGGDSVLDSNNKLTLNWNELNKKAKRIVIVTKIKNDASFDTDSNKPGNSLIENTAKLSAIKGMDEEVSANHSLSFKREALVSKTANRSGNIITWTVKFRGDGKSQEFSLDDTLTLPENIGLSLDKASVYLKKSGTSGNGTMLASAKITIDSSNNEKIKFNVTTPTTDLYELTYKTELVYNSNQTYGENSNTNIKNSVTYQGITASASAKVERGTLYTKEYGRIYGNADGDTFIDWNITINKNNEKWNNVVVEDYVPSGFSFVSAKIEGAPENLTAEEVKKDDVYNYTKIAVGNITNSTTIIVTTQVEAKSELNTTTANIAKINWQLGHTGTGIGIGDWKDVNSGTDVIKGSVGSQQYQYSSTKSSKGITLPYEEDGYSEASWEIKYESFNKSMENHKIEDQLKDSYTTHIYDQGSFKVKLKGDSTWSKVVVGTSNVLPENATEGLETLKYSLSIDDSTRKFTFTILGGTKVTDSNYNSIELKYDTKFKLSEINTPIGYNVNNDIIKLTNEAKIYQGVGNPVLTKTASQSVKYEVSQNGEKKLLSTNVNDRVLKWEVNLNHKGKTIATNETITDTLTGKQRYDLEKITITKAELQGDGTLKKVANGKLTSDEEYTITTTGNSYTYEDGDKVGQTVNYHTGMIIEFLKPLTSPIIIEYETEMVGISASKYENKVVFKTKEYSKYINHSQSNQFIDKKAVLENNAKINKGDILEWKIVANASLSEIHGFNLVDEMGAGLIFIEGSIKITDSKGKVVYPTNQGGTPEFSVVEEDTGFTLTSDYIKDKYTISYNTFVNTPVSSKNIYNNIKFSGWNLEEKAIVSEKHDTSVRRSASAGGTLKDTEYILKIEKTDLENKIITDGTAKFLLTTTRTIGSKEYTTEDVLTTANGVVNTIIEKDVKYTIKEIEAPEGYAKLDKEYRVDFSTSVGTGNSKTITITVPNAPKTSVKATKVWTDGPATRPTVYFMLYTVVNENLVEVPGAELKEISSNITVTWDNLPSKDEGQNNYEYTVREVYVEEKDGELIVSGIIAENIITDNYKVSYGNMENNEMKITNTYVSPTKTVTAYKNWTNGTPGNRATIYFKLFRALEQGTPEVVPNAIIGKLSDGATSYTWEGIDKTDKDGKSYTFTVKEVDKAGNEITEENPLEDHYLPEYSGDGLTVTNTRKTYAVGDYTWIDENKDGIQDEDEPVLSGVIVELYKDGDPSFKMTTTTDKKGRYLFDELYSGKYRVRFVLTEEQEKSYRFTLQDTGANEAELDKKDSDANSNVKDSEYGFTAWFELNDATVIPQEDYDKEYKRDQNFKATQGIDPTWDAGVIRKTYAIGDYVWIDSNNNGLQDEGEKPLEGVKVELFDENGDKIGETETDENGKYIFDELVGGKYSVKFTLTTQQARIYRFTKQDAKDDTKDSDADTRTGFTKQFILDDDNENLTLDYDDQEFTATEGIDPTWDAGVVLIPEDPYYPPTRPTDPKPPVNPPTEPTEPTEPVKPTDPTDPVDPTDPTDPIDPIDPTEPTEPKEPIIEETPNETPKEGEVEVPEGSPEPPKVNNPPENGTVTVDENGKWIYTPNPGFVGKDKFSIIITHPDGTEEEIFFEIDVAPPLGGTGTGTGTETEALPKTGQLNSILFYLAGLFFVIVGIILRKKTA